MSRELQRETRKGQIITGSYVHEVAFNSLNLELFDTLSLFKLRAVLILILGEVIFILYGSQN